MPCHMPLPVAMQASLVRLQRKWPTVFTDLCVYSDVSHLLAVYRYNLYCLALVPVLVLV